MDITKRPGAVVTRSGRENVRIRTSSHNTPKLLGQPDRSTPKTLLVSWQVSRWLAVDRVQVR
jgi:hypothetical protein